MTHWLRNSFTGNNKYYYCNVLANQVQVWRVSHLIWWMSTLTWHVSGEQQNFCRNLKILPGIRRLNHFTRKLEIIIPDIAISTLYWGRSLWAGVSGEGRGKTEVPPPPLFSSHSPLPPPSPFYACHTGYGDIEHIFDFRGFHCLVKKYFMEIAMV